MSALWAADPDSRPVAAPKRSGAELRAVDRPPARLSRAPFLLVLIGVFGLGMAGLLMLNTTLQNQAFSSRALNRQATELAYTQAALENQIDVLSAPPELARRASALGMRPNPYPVFLELPSGKVVGEPRPVSGTEVPSMVVKTPAEVAAEKVAAEAKAKAKAAKEKAAKEKAERAAAAKKKAEAKKAAEAKAAEDKKPAEKKPTPEPEGQD
nr:hypothetical protein [uncultured Friedmanniella sp.]